MQCHSVNRDGAIVLIIHIDRVIENEKLEMYRSRHIQLLNTRSYLHTRVGRSPLHIEKKHRLLAFDLSARAHYIPISKKKWIVKNC